MAVSGRHGDRSKGLRALILNHKHEVERERELQLERGFKLSKPTSRDVLPPMRQHLLKPPQRAPPTGDQMFNV